MSRIPDKVHSKWQYYIDDFTVEVPELYENVVEAVKNTKCPDLVFRKIVLREAGAFSSERTYLRIRYKNLSYDVCAANFGGGAFFSCRMGEHLLLLRGLLMKIPYVGETVERTLFPQTYYIEDTTAMVNATITKAVQDVINDTLSNEGRREMTSEEMKPILRSVYPRM